MKKVDKIYGYLFLILFVVFMITEPILNFILLGGYILYMSINYLFTVEKLKKSGKVQFGEYMGYNADDEGYKTPVIEFKTHDDQLIQKEPFFYMATDLSKVGKYKSKIGTRVQVIYDQRDPKVFIIKKEKYYNYFGLYMMIFVSLVFIVSAILHFMNVIDINM